MRTTGAGLRIVVGKRSGPVRGNVLYEGTPQRHIEYLNSATYCESRKIQLPGGVHQRNFRFVAGPTHTFQRVMRGISVKGGIDVTSAREKQAVYSFQRRKRGRGVIDRR